MHTLYIFLLSNPRIVFLEVAYPEKELLRFSLNSGNLFIIERPSPYIESINDPVRNRNLHER